MGYWIFSFAGLAMLYAGLVSLAVLLTAKILVRFPGWRTLPLLFTTLTFVFLTQHPFPVPAQLDCPVPSAAPQLHFFEFWGAFAKFIEHDTALTEWLSNRTVAATVMNFLVCLVVGLTLARHATRLRSAVVFGAALTLSVELTQLTGLWGLYPCAYRQFNVDDLILNVSGFVTGFLLARAISRHSARRMPD